MALQGPEDEVAPYADFTTTHPVAKINKIVAGSPCIIWFDNNDVQKVAENSVIATKYTGIAQGRYLLEERTFVLGAQNANGSFPLNKSGAPYNIAGNVNEFSGGYAVVLGTVTPTTPPPYAASVENISNQNPATVKVSADAFPYFPVGTMVYFSGTGSEVLDAGEQYSVLTTNEVGKTFKIAANLTGEPSSINTGVVYAIQESGTEFEDA